MNEATAELYAQGLDNGDEFPAVDVFEDLDGVLYLADGYHRTVAHERRGRNDIMARVHRGDRRAAILYALTQDQNRPRTQADKRHAVAILLGDMEWRDWSDQVIGRRCGVDPKTVGAARKRLGLVRPERTKTADGREMDTRPIGKRRSKRTKEIPESTKPEGASESPSTGDGDQGTSQTEGEPQGPDSRDPEDPTGGGPADSDHHQEQSVAGSSAGKGSDQTAPTRSSGPAEGEPLRATPPIGVTYRIPDQFHHPGIRVLGVGGGLATIEVLELPDDPNVATPPSEDSPMPLAPPTPPDGIVHERVEGTPMPMPASVTNEPDGPQQAGEPEPQLEPNWATLAGASVRHFTDDEVRACWPHPDRSKAEPLKLELELEGDEAARRLVYGRYSAFVQQADGNKRKALLAAADQAGLVLTEPDDLVAGMTIMITITSEGGQVATTAIGLVMVDGELPDFLYSVQGGTPEPCFVVRMPRDAFAKKASVWVPNAAPAQGIAAE